MQTYLLTTFHTDAHPERDKELKTVLDINLRQNFERIYLFGDTNPGTLLQNPKLSWCPHEGRTQFGHMLQHIHSLQRPGDLFIMANADIFFKNETLEQIKDVYRRGPSNLAMANSRYDVYNFVDENTFTDECFCRPDSQDFWCIKGIPTFTQADYIIGKPGCDQKIAFELNQAGYTVVNLAKSIKAYHLHISNHRSYYVNGSAIPGYTPPFLLIEPQSLLEAQL